MWRQEEEKERCVREERRAGRQQDKGEEERSAEGGTAERRGETKEARRERELLSEMERILEVRIISHLAVVPKNIFLKELAF